jgi:nitrate reductase gamma subunit
VSPGEALVWVGLPYAALAIFAVGHVWRYRRDQLGWTSRSTQLLERPMLAWGSNLFHWGALAAIAGHFLGILVPKTVTGAIGIDEHAYHVLSAVAGSIAGIVCAAGLVILAYRRASVARVRVTTSAADLAVYVLLFLLIGLGLWETVVVNAFGNAYDYRETVGPWFRSIFYFHPKGELMTDAPVVYQVHAAAAFLIIALWPFSRLVHAWSIPFQYLGRPYILYRRRYPQPRAAK